VILTRPARSAWDPHALRGRPAPQSPEEPSSILITTAKPRRRPLPEHLPRTTQTHLPQSSVCPDCGGELRKLGEDVSEVLEYGPACFKVIRHVRPKLSCGHCERIVRAPAPSRPIARGLAGTGLLAHVLISKYCDHQPLYRQSEIYARAGVELERSTLADWVGGTSELLGPLVEAVCRYVMAGSKFARRRHARAGAGARKRQDQDGALVDARSR
jgi:transposase